MKLTIIALLIALVVITFSLAFAYPSLVGYSGAPGSNGNCASSCHGSSGGTIQVTGLPESYEPEQTYELAISHSGGNPIRQFNGSIRVGAGSDNAGVISSGTNTATYNNANETNGIRFSSENQDNGTFSWTAPSAGTGEVRLYVAGLQGGFSGQNSELVIVSNESVDFIYGDANGNGNINILDITYLISYLYKGGPAPVPPESGDANCNGSINILDITYLIAYLYKGGPAPGC